MSLGTAYKRLGFIPLKDFQIVDNGEQVIVRWLSSQPQPSQEEIEGVLADSWVFVPADVSQYQARMALKAFNLLAEVNSYIDGLGSEDDAYIAWHYAERIHRKSPFVISVGTQFGLSSQQIDALFVLAGGM